MENIQSKPKQADGSAILILSKRSDSLAEELRQSITLSHRWGEGLSKTHIPGVLLHESQAQNPGTEWEASWEQLRNAFSWVWEWRAVPCVRSLCLRIQSLL